MTKRIKQKLAHKRKHNDEHLAEKEVKKARKAEVVQTTSCLVVEQLVGGPSLALPALARCGGAEDDPPLRTRWMNSLHASLSIPTDWALV